MAGNKLKLLLVAALLLLFSIGLVNAKKHHHVSAEDDEFGGLDPDELIQSQCIGVKPVTRRKHMADLKSMVNCSHTRDDVVQMLNWGFDINNDHVISKGECGTARDHLLNWVEKAFVEGCDEIFRHCDCDGNGVLTTQDVMDSIDTCLRNCEKVELAVTYGMDRIKNRNVYGN